MKVGRKLSVYASIIFLSLLPLATCSAQGNTSTPLKEFFVDRDSFFATVDPTVLQEFNITKIDPIVLNAEWERTRMGIIDFLSKKLPKQKISPAAFGMYFLPLEDVEPCEKFRAIILCRNQSDKELLSSVAKVPSECLRTVSEAEAREMVASPAIYAQSMSRNFVEGNTKILFGKIAAAVSEMISSKNSVCRRLQLLEKESVVRKDGMTVYTNWKVVSRTREYTHAFRINYEVRADKKDSSLVYFFARIQVAAKPSGEKDTKYRMVFDLSKSPIYQSYLLGAVVSSTEGRLVGDLYMGGFQAQEKGKPLANEWEISPTLQKLNPPMDLNNMKLNVLDEFKNLLASDTPNQGN